MAILLALIGIAAAETRPSLRLPVAASPESLAAAASAGSPLINKLRGGGLPLIRDYLKLCELYNTKPHPSVLTALRWDLPHIHPQRQQGTRPFRDHDLLPLTDLLLLPTATHITSLSFRGCRLRSSGAVMLAKLIIMLPQLESLDLTGNKLGPEAGALLADALSHSRSLKELRLKGCRLRKTGTDALALMLATSEPHESAPLRLLDLSNNQIGFRSKAGIEKVNAMRERPIVINLAGNLVLTEALNTVTHGGGTAAAIVGSAWLMREVRHAPAAIRISSAVYAATLILCYASSTLFHSSFMLGTARKVFHVFDQCAIYLLIAGSYTPFMTVLFHPHKRVWSVYLLGFMWSLCFAGIAMELLFHSVRQVEPWLKYYSVVLYVVMGWCAAFPPLFRDMRRAMEPKAMQMLIAGGLAYTLGVPAFMRNRGLDHVVWHLFVLAGSVLHYLSLMHNLRVSLVGTL